MWMVTLNGVQTPLGVSDPRAEGEAWEKLRALVAGAVREAIPPPAAGPGAKPGTVAELVPEFLAAKSADVSPRTLAGYDKYLKWLRKHWPAEPVASLDAKAVRARAAAEEWSDTHRANTLWCANAFLRWCGRDEHIPRPPRDSRGAETVIPDGVYRRILAETSGDFRSLCQFLWLTGCRPGEATGLAFDAVNWDARTIRVKKHKCRHKGMLRTLHLCAEAVAVLEDQGEKYGREGLVFRGLRGRRLSLQAMTMRFWRVSEKVGRTVTSYQFRHTFATRALAAGESDTVVAALLGHSSTAMIHRHYSHVSEQGRALQDAAERIAKK